MSYKLPPLSMELEEQVDEIHDPPRSQYLSTDTTGTTNFPTRTVDDPNRNLVGTILALINLITNRSSSYSINRETTFKKNIFNAIGNFLRFTTREAVGEISFRGNSHIQKEISREENPSFEHMPTNFETRRMIRSENDMVLEYQESLANNTNANKPQTRRMERTECGRENNFQGYPQNQDNDLKFRQESRSGLENEHERMKVEPSKSGRKRLASAIQDMQCQNARSSTKPSALSKSNRVENESIYPPKKKTVASEKARRLKIKLECLKQMNERWKRKRDEIKQEITKCPSPEKMVQKRIKNSLHIRNRETEGSRTTSNKENVDTQKTSSDIFQRFKVPPEFFASLTYRRNKNSFPEHSVISPNAKVQRHISRKKRKKKSLKKLPEANSLQKNRIYRHVDSNLHYLRKPSKMSIPLNIRGGKRISSKEMGERCWRNRNKILRETPLKYPSLSKLLEELRLNSLNSGIECQSVNESNENSIINPSSPSLVNLNIENIDSVVACCRSYNYEYVDAIQSLEPNMKTIFVRITSTNIRSDHNYSNSTFVETNHVIEINQGGRRQNYTQTRFMSNSITEAASNTTQFLWKKLKSVKLAMTKQVINLTHNFRVKNMNCGLLLNCIRCRNESSEEHFLSDASLLI